MLPFFLLFMIAYLIGSIPSGWLLARLVGIADITKHGSGNIGATNVARVAGIRYFFIVFFLDCIKAYLLLFFLMLFKVSSFGLLIAASGLLIGNGFSLFLNGKGGKGVATTIGILLALNSAVLYSMFMIWLCALLITKNMGITSVMTLLSLPVVTVIYSLSNPLMIILSLFITGWGLWRHESNIRSFINAYKTVL